MRDSLSSARVALLWTALVVVALVWAMRDLALLIGYSVLLAYTLLPVVRAIERLHGPRGRSLPRPVVAATLILGLVALTGWFLVLAVPRLLEEAARFSATVPDAALAIAERMREYAFDHGFSALLDPVVEHVRGTAAGLMSDIGGTVSRWLGPLFGGLAQVLGVALVPLLAFYLLAEAEAVQDSFLRFAPVEARSEILRLGVAVDRALQSYVRGQTIVCVLMGTAVGIALALLHCPAPFLLAFLVALGELIPYLGFLVAALAIVLTGSSVSLFCAVSALVAYIAINWAIGTFVTPRVMGRYLRMHPLVVTVSVLAGAQLLGPAGSLLALPGAAVIQTVIAGLAPLRTAVRPGDGPPPAPTATA